MRYWVCLALALVLWSWPARASALGLNPMALCRAVNTDGGVECYLRQSTVHRRWSDEYLIWTLPRQFSMLPDLVEVEGRGSGRFPIGNAMQVPLTYWGRVSVQYALAWTPKLQCNHHYWFALLSAITGEPIARVAFRYVC